MPAKDDRQRKRENEERSRMIYESSYYFSPTDIENEIRSHQKKRAKLVTAISLSAIVAVLLIIFAVIVYTKFFRIKNVRVSSFSDITSEQMQEISGIRPGQLLYQTSTKSAKTKIMLSVPYVDTVSIKRLPPSEVKITLTQKTPTLYIQYGGYFYELDFDLDVMSKTKDIEMIESKHIPKLVCDHVTKCVVGEKLMIDDEDIPKILDELFSEFSEREMLAECNKIDISSKFDIRFTYKNLYDVRLGKQYSIGAKLNFMESIVSRLYDGDVGVIDVTDDNIEEGFFSPYK